MYWLHLMPGDLVIEPARHSINNSDWPLDIPASPTRVLTITRIMTIEPDGLLITGLLDDEMHSLRRSLQNEIKHPLRVVRKGEIISGEEIATPTIR